MDSYFKIIKEIPVAESPITGKAYADYNHPTSFDLDKLKRELSSAITSKQYQVIIIEGLLTLWDEEIYKQLDLKLFVECSSDERIVRRLKRNMQWGLSFDEIANAYLDLVKFRHDEFVEPCKWRADLILNGSVSSKKMLEIIATYVYSQFEMQYQETCI